MKKSEFLLIIKSTKKVVLYLIAFCLITTSYIFASKIENKSNESMFTFTKLGTEMSIFKSYFLPDKRDFYRQNIIEFYDIKGEKDILKNATLFIFWWSNKLNKGDFYERET